MPEQCSNSDLYSQFPETFKWGSTSSATQIQAAWTMDGRSMSWWDSDSVSRKNSDEIMSLSQVEGDSLLSKFERVFEDVRLLKEMNATCYKFSLSWSKLLPEGITGKVNKAGVEYYNALIDALLANGIEPIVVLYHWDFPQELFESHPINWSDDRVIRAFGNYARFCFKRFGDRVKRFIPIHDPWMHAGQGSDLKTFKNLVKANNLAHKVYEKAFKRRQGGGVGISVNSRIIQKSEKVCLRNEVAVPDYAACKELRTSLIPNASSDTAPLCWLELRGASSDFVDLTLEDGHVHVEVSGGRRNSISSMSLTRMVLNRIKSDLGNKEVLLCGKGYPLQEGNEGLRNLQDLKETSGFRGWAEEVLKAVALDGCNVGAFLPGTLVDSWEWEHGFSLYQGLHQVRMDSKLKWRLQRYLGKIGKFYQQKWTEVEE